MNVCLYHIVGLLVIIGLCCVALSLVTTQEQFATPSPSKYIVIAYRGSKFCGNKKYFTKTTRRTSLPFKPRKMSVAKGYVVFGYTTASSKPYVTLYEGTHDLERMTDNHGNITKDRIVAVSISETQKNAKKGVVTTKKCVKK